MSKNDGFLFQDGQTVVFIGDSITDCGRRAAERPFGNGYVRQAIDLITARYPDRHISYFNEGISADTSIGLRNRWEDDVLVHRPDWVSVLIGINDLNHTLRTTNTAEHVPVEVYRQTYGDLLDRTARETNARLILMDPFYISRETDQMSYRRQMLDRIGQYIDVVADMADRFNAIHLPLHEVFQHQLACRPADTFCGEPIHPNSSGHLIIAHSILAAIGW